MIAFCITDEKPHRNEPETMISKRKITHLLIPGAWLLTWWEFCFCLFVFVLITVWGWKFWVVGFNWQEKSKVLSVHLCSAWPEALLVFTLQNFSLNKVVNIIYSVCVCCFINICIMYFFIRISCNMVHNLISIIEVRTRVFFTTKLSRVYKLWQDSCAATSWPACAWDFYNRKYVMKSGIVTSVSLRISGCWNTMESRRKVSKVRASMPNLFMGSNNFDG